MHEEWVVVYEIIAPIRKTSEFYPLLGNHERNAELYFKNFQLPGNERWYSDFDVLKKPIAQVTAKKIPLVTINSGTTAQSEQLGAIMHVGQPDYDAGKAAGERAKAAGVKSFLCVNHYATNPASFERCKGFADALGVDFRKATLDSGIDPNEVTAKVSANLRNNPGTEAVLTLCPNSAIPTLEALDQMGLKGKIYMCTFDLAPEIAAGIKDGSVKFAIDQQPYLQGYIPVAALALMKQMKTQDLAKVMAALKANPKARQICGAFTGFCP